MKFPMITGLNLEQKRHQVVGRATSYQQAKLLFKQYLPDLVLIDTQLDKEKTGIDFARFLRRQTQYRPFSYLASQLDNKTITEAKATFPAGFLCRPIQKGSLFATIEIAMHTYQAQENEKSIIRLFNGRRYYLVPVDDILYLQSDHIYVRVFLTNQQQLLPRISLKELLEQLPQDQFVQTHRSYAINIKRVEHWDADNFYLNSAAIPVSRSRRKKVLSYLENR